MERKTQIEFLMFALFYSRNGRWPENELGATEWREARLLWEATREHLGWPEVGGLSWLKVP